MRNFFRLISILFWFVVIGTIVAIFAFPESTLVLRAIPIVGPYIQPPVTWVTTLLNNLVTTATPAVISTAKSVDVYAAVSNRNTWITLVVLVVVISIVYMWKNRNENGGITGTLKQNWLYIVGGCLVAFIVYRMAQGWGNLPALFVAMGMFAVVLFGGHTFTGNASKAIAAAAGWIVKVIIYGFLTIITISFASIGTGLLPQEKAVSFVSSMVPSWIQTPITGVIDIVGSIGANLGPLNTAIVAIIVFLVTISVLKKNGSTRHIGG